MSDLARKLMMGAAGSGERTYVEDVFNVYTNIGNNDATIITNGIDLASKGGLVWIKHRDSSLRHRLFDTARGVGKGLTTSSDGYQTSTDAQVDYTSSFGVTSFNSNGFRMMAGNGSDVNGTGRQVTWTFRKAPRFFDIVTYTGDGVAGRTISHSLGVAPGMMVIKRYSAGGNEWAVYHRGLLSSQGLAFNEMQGKYTATGYWNSTAPTSSVFTLGASSTVNANGSLYIAYLFAHDASADGLIQCGTYSGNLSTDGPEISLGWEPQYILIKNRDSSGNWQVLDNVRGISTSTVSSYNDYIQQVNNSSGDDGIGTGNVVDLKQTGFKIVTSSSAFNAAESFIYVAIRRGPMKPPTDATKVHKSAIWTGNSTARNITGIGFRPDLAFIRDRSATTGYSYTVQDSLRGVGQELWTWDVSTSEFDMGVSTISSFDMDGISLGTDGGNHGYNVSSNPEVGHFFKRAAGFLDVVCYTGTGGASNINHNLGVVPELILVKSRNTSGYGWVVYSAPTTSAKWLQLNATSAAGNLLGAWNNTDPTSSLFTIGSDPWVSGNGTKYVAYLFASCPGVSKVGTYTGNGSSLNIDCGFTNGARFLLIKRTDSTGNWYVWDTVRGITTGNDPWLLLNSTNAETTTDDSVDPLSSGFTVNQVAATNINVNTANYIYLAIA